MVRKFSLIALTAALGIFSMHSANAQFLGAYQQGLVNAISDGASAGAEHGGVPGAIVGGVASAGYYDTQHQGRIVHDHRAPRVTRTCFDYGHGAFVQQGAAWVEYQNGRLAYHFREVARTRQLIELIDRSGNLIVHIHNGQAFILLPGRNWQFLYNGRSL